MALLRRRRQSADRLIDRGWATAIADRSENQDRCSASASWAVVSDGVGGHAGGARAAELTVSTIVGSLRSKPHRVDGRRVVRAVHRANAAVRAAREADDTVAEMSATLTMAAATAVHIDESKWLVVNIGDSPAWLCRTRDGQLTRLTRDHTLAAELVSSGTISGEKAKRHPARHVVTRAIGLHDIVVADATTLVLHRSDTLLIASDGLNVLDAAEMQRLIAESSTDTAHHAAHHLVAAALDHGARDNVTAVLLRHRR